MNTGLLSKLKIITLEEQEILNGRRDIDSSIYNFKKNMIVDSGKLLTHGKLIQIRPHTRFIHFPKHTHNYVEVVYMCSGQTCHVIDGSKVILHTGELLFLSQNTTQEIYPAKEEDVAVNFIILPEFFDKPLNMIGMEKSLIREFLIDCLKNTSHNVNYLHFKVADAIPIQNLIENLIFLLLESESNKRDLSQTTMGLLFMHLANYTDKVEIGKDHLIQELTLAVFRYIEERYYDGELSDLANTLGYDLYYLSRIIKKTTGKTYTELLQTKRLNQAAYLLSCTSLSITDIALHVGYHNFSYFYRIFKKYYKVSPRAYRLNIG